jgi:hypothetical protein
MGISGDELLRRYDADGCGYRLLLTARPSMTSSFDGHLYRGSSRVVLRPLALDGRLDIDATV